MASSKSSNPKHKQLYTNQNLIFQGNQTFKVGLFSEKYTVWKSSIMSHLKWHFPLIFVPSKLTYLAKLFDCKLKVFKKSPKLTIFLKKTFVVLNLVRQMRLFLWFSNNVQRANAMGLKLRLCTLLIKWARNSLWCSIVIISGFKGEKPAFFATKYIKTF